MTETKRRPKSLSFIAVLYQFAVEFDLFSFSDLGLLI